MKIDKAAVAYLWHTYQGLDWCLLVVLLVVMACVTTLVKPHCRSFQWTDAAIGYPMKPDTFPNWSVALFVILPFVIFVVGTLVVVPWLQTHLPEPLTLLSPSRFTRRAEPPTSPTGREDGAQTDERRTRTPADIYGYRTRQMEAERGPLYAWFRAHIWALTLELFIMALAKSYAGRLRPDYIDRLRAAGYTASDSSLPDPTANPEFYCKLMDAHPALKEGRFSFPSGHSSTSFACCMMVCFYFLAHLRPFARQGSFVRLFIAISPLWPAFACAISRTRDNKHHFSDILAGTVLGIACAVVCFAVCFRELGGLAGALNIYVARTENDVEYVRRQQSEQRPCEGLVEVKAASDGFTVAETTAVAVDERGFGRGDAPAESPTAPFSPHPSETQLNRNTQTVPWL